jgi:hypothetical protein
MNIPAFFMDQLLVPSPWRSFPPPGEARSRENKGKKESQQSEEEERGEVATG